MKQIEISVFAIIIYNDRSLHRLTLFVEANHIQPILSQLCILAVEQVHGIHLAHNIRNACRKGEILLVTAIKHT